MLTWFQQSWAANDAAGRMSLIMITLIGAAFLALAVVGGAIQIWNDWQADGQLTWQSFAPICVICFWLGLFAGGRTNARR